MRSRLYEPSEREFQTLVLDIAAMNKWKVTHFRPGMNRRGEWATPLQGDPGWPDLVLVKPPRAIFAELKSARGKLSPEQVEWLEALRGCGLDVRVWFPSDLDEIESTLGRRSA